MLTLRKQSKIVITKRNAVGKGMKICPRCGPQPISKFNKNCTKKDGLAVQCKNCTSRYSKRYYRANRTQIKRRVKAYRDSARGRKVRSAATKTYRKRLRRKVLEHLGGRCSSRTCGWVNGDGSRGCTDVRALQIDHPKGGGTEERNRLSNSHSSFYRIVLKAKKGTYQLLCANCNWIKRWVNKEGYHWK